MLQHAYAPIHASRRPPRPHTTAIGFVAAIHVVAIFGLIHALKPTAEVERPLPPIRADFRDEVQPNDIPPPPPLERAEAPQPDVPMPDPVIISTPVRVGTNVISPPETPTVPDVPDNPPVVLTPARPAGTQTGPTYPPISRRLGEEGTVRLRLTVTAEGRVSEAMLLESSGFERLDTAAINWVIRNWRYEPAREGSRAVESMVEASLTFRLER